MNRLALVVLLGLAGPAAADRTNTRFTQELDSAEFNHGHPFDWRLATRFDVHYAAFEDLGDDAEYDFSARRRKMVYEVEPVSTVTLAGRYALRFGDHGEPIYLDAAYGTSRPFGDDGQVTEREAGPLQALGFDGTASTLLDLGLEYFGLSGRVAWEEYRAGTVRVVGDGMADEERPFVLRRFTGRVTYNFRPIELFEDVDGKWRPYRPFGFTIYAELHDYTLPRILYRVREIDDPGPDDARFVYVGESSPQDVRTRTWALGGTALAQILRTEGLGLTGHLELGGAFGGGEIAFDYEGRERSETVLVGKVDVAALTTVRVPVDPALLELSLQYNVELLNYFTPESGGTFFEPGTRDVFHGPRFELIARF